MKKLPQDPISQLLRIALFITDGDLSLLPEDWHYILFGHIAPERIERHKDLLRQKFEEMSRANSE